MMLNDLRFLYQASGPFVTVYLDTSGTVADSPPPVRRRWKSLRRELVGAGAPEAALAAIDPLVDAADPTGETLTVIANRDGVLLAANLPDAPTRDLGRCGMLPAVVPLLAWRQRELPYVVVATDRLGAELLAVVPAGSDHAVRVQGEELHVTRSAPGGWSQRRFQQRAENRWQQNADAVAEALTKLVDDIRPRLVVVAGDVRATQLLRDQVPGRVGEVLQVVDGEYDSLDGALAKAAPLVDLLEARDSTQVLAGFGRELGKATGPPTDPPRRSRPWPTPRSARCCCSQERSPATPGSAGPRRRTRSTYRHCMQWVSAPQPKRPWSTSPSVRPPPAAPPCACWPTSSPTDADPPVGSGRCCATPDSPATAEYALACPLPGCWRLRRTRRLTDTPGAGPYASSG
jgi:Bacterial archaeo-eukaryotic release factor family 2